MVKALIKKQFMELCSSFFRSKRNRRKRTALGAAGLLVYFIAIMVFVGVMMYVFSGTFAETLLTIPDGSFDWFFFALMGIMAILLGVLGSIFSTVSTLYQAKDNELLLSMPIPPSVLLVSRMIGISAMSLLYSMIVWIPAVVRYCVMRHPDGKTVLMDIVLQILIALLITVLGCAAGWVVAMISGKLRNKSYITVIIFLIFFGFYYFICFRLNTILAALVARSEQIGTGIRTWVYPVYALGMAATGKGFYLLTFALIVIVLAAICWFVLARTFIRIATLKKGEKKAVYHEKTVRQKGVRQALLGRELTRFTKSATYMLNCGLALVLMPAAAIVVLFYKNAIRTHLPMIFESAPEYLQLIPVVLCAFVCLASATNPISAPSVSLEGKAVWLVQSLPVRTMDILHAKEKMHFLLNYVPAAVSLLILAYVFQIDALTTLLMLVCLALFIMYSAGFGLKRGLKHPNLSWTSESIPIKQGAAVVISLFAGWGLCIAAGGLYYFALPYVKPQVWLGLCCALLILAVELNERWLRKKGTVLFEEL